MKKLPEKLDLNEWIPSPGDRFRWDDDYDLGMAIRRLEGKINEIISYLESKEIKES